MRAQARRDATIFQPPIEPLRSSTKMTSRGSSAFDTSTGGTIVSAKVPPFPSSSSFTTTEVFTAFAP